MREVQPTLLFAVPRIWNRIYDSVMAQMAARPPAIRTTFEVGMRARSKQRRGQALSLSERAALMFVERLVVPKILAKLGGRLRFAFSGAAALSVEVAELIDNLGIDVFEGYGMTEGSGVITTNSAEQRRLGSVGKPVPGVVVKLQAADGATGDEGEIIVYGTGVMAGYHGLADATTETLTPDCGLRTGDLGRFDADGFLYITGRVKELFKLSNGRYVAPSALEERLQLSPYIAQAFLYGDNQLHPVALLVVDPHALSSWAKSRSLPHELDELLRHPATQELYARELEKHSRSFKAYERVRSFILEPEPFTIENGLLTPTLKVRRRRVVEAYERRLLALYGRESLPSPSASSNGHVSPLLS
jgi:long-chain acyl-CoA synthetase